MSITYGEAKSILAKYQGVGGHCPTAQGVDLFVREVLQYMLYQGAEGNIRKFTFYAQNGCVTLPYELETPLKVKIEEVTGNVFTSFFEYHTNMRMDKCLEANEALYDDPNRYPTVYDVPTSGGYPAVLANCTEDTAVIIKGTDLTGREIFTTHNGEDISGVKLTLQKGKLKYTDIKFGRITEVYKEKTNGYVQLFTLSEAGTKTFLADYSPVETKPSYRRVRLVTKNCPDKALVSILGRIRLKPAYADEDLIPFDNIYALSVAGQAVNKSYNDDDQGAQIKGALLEKLIETEGNFKKSNNGQPLEVSPITAGSHVKNIIRRSNFYRRRW